MDPRDPTTLGFLPTALEDRLASKGAKLSKVRLAKIYSVSDGKCSVVSTFW